jgi:hypothetical protein
MLASPLARPIAALSCSLLACALSLAGCAKNDASSPDASPSPAALVTSAADDTAATGAPAVPDASHTPASPTAAASAVPATAAFAAYTDIAGVNGEREIRELAALGVFGSMTPAFRPGAPILRRDFIRWLVKADDALWSDTPAKQVHTADATETSAFRDIGPSDPDFPYVQGMQDAGYSVGFPDKTFKPDQALTREQMFAIKNVFDHGSVDAGLVKNVDYARNTALPPWKDKAQISKTYVAAIATANAMGVNNDFSRVYGASSLFHPQQAVTRAQAATILATIGDHTFYGGQSRTAAAVLASASASPAP